MPLLQAGSGLAGAVGLLRNFIVPLGALLILLVQANQVSAEATPVRVVATPFGFVVLVLLLSGSERHACSKEHRKARWRKRIPSIFLDVTRFALIAIGLGLILSYVWGARVGGLFTALGVSSIVLGLVLQNAVGQIVSGLLLFFEQPFQLGDWIDTPSARGRVVEVNWRATHIDTGSGLQIMPNSVLAAASFTNLSRPPGIPFPLVTTVFGLDDPPDEVCAMLTRVAGTLPQLRPDATPSSGSAGGLQYKTSIPLRSPADAFAANRPSCAGSGTPLGEPSCISTRPKTTSPPRERLETSVRIIAPTMRLSQADQQELLPHACILRYGTDEILQFPGEVPKRMTFVVNGRIRLVVYGGRRRR